MSSDDGDLTDGQQRRYRTIVVDPPWRYHSWPGPISKVMPGTLADWCKQPRKPIAYPTLSVPEIAALPVANLAEPSGCHVYLWTTNHYLRAAFDVFDAWGVRYGQTLVWAKTPMGQGPGGTFAQNAEFVLFGRRGSLPHLRRFDSVWFNWPRSGIGQHSRKPEHFLDLVEQVSPGPRVELFARRHRLGWDVWGDESANTASLVLPTAASGTPASEIDIEEHNPW